MKLTKGKLNIVMRKIKTEVTIHTNTFACSFNDELCAYMTGEQAQGDVDMPGGKEAEEFQNDTSIPECMKDAFSGWLDEVEGEYGSTYTCDLTTPGWFNHGMGQIYEDTPENEAIARIDFKKEQIEYAQKYYTGVHLEKELAKINKSNKLIKYASEQGILIAFTRQLTKEELEFLKMRAYQYASIHDIKILSFEVEEIETKTKTTSRKIM